ncbi:MAG: MtnX-like HAD-IB family phosphatase [Candidatus Omnitrophica bacterium]|nr:MtnX-like HAD-IB family phosphatase [Candidatus Omnitrophota bacterium]
MSKTFVVFFDFDNTITTIDVIDDMLERFSGDGRWKELEERWRREEIGSRECLKGQVEGIRIAKENLDNYLSTIKIDPYFKKLLKFLRSRNIPALIVSDNFEYIIKKILKRNGISDVDIYSNRLSVCDGRLDPAFPFTNEECGDCANCKKERVVSGKKDGALAVYIGDGRSDLCAAKESDIVFAKDYLKETLEKEKKPCVPIGGLKDVYDYFIKSF